MPPKKSDKKSKTKKKKAVPPRCTLTQSKRTTYRKKNKKQIKGLKNYAKCARKPRLTGCKKKQRKGAYQNPDDPSLPNFRLGI